MKRIILAALVFASFANGAFAGDDLAQGFARPPQSARPWVYWFPLSGNLSNGKVGTAHHNSLGMVGDAHLTA